MTIARTWADMYDVLPERGAEFLAADKSEISSQESTEYSGDGLDCEVSENLS